MKLRRIENPPNPFESWYCDYFPEFQPETQLEIYEDTSRSILSRNDSPDLGFRWSVNPYRGCMHACAYCYARPTHEYLGFGAGSDFETKILVKKNAPSLLKKALLKPTWIGEPIIFSGNTDCYQPLEAHFRLTRQCLEVCLQFKNPAVIITKSYLIVRDLDVLQELARQRLLQVMISVAFRDDSVARRLEPMASLASKRLEAIKKLSEAGVPTGILIAPVIPHLNDADIPLLLCAARQMGASFADYALIRLPLRVRQVFLSRLKMLFPRAAKKIIHGILETHGGRFYDPRFGERFQGKGPHWQTIEQLFELECKRLGFSSPKMSPRKVLKTAPYEKQLMLFD